MSTAWRRTEQGMEGRINGSLYLIEREKTWYSVYCDGALLSDGIDRLSDAVGVAEDHAAAPAPAKQGVHIDNIAGQQLIDILKRSFTTSQIQDFMDASPFDEPDTGAPEGPMG